MFLKQVTYCTSTPALVAIMQMHMYPDHSDASLLIPSMHISARFPIFPLRETSWKIHESSQNNLSLCSTAENTDITFCSYVISHDISHFFTKVILNRYLDALPVTKSHLHMFAHVLVSQETKPSETTQGQIGERGSPLYRPQCTAVT